MSITFDASHFQSDVVRVCAQDYFKKGVDSGWDHRKLSRILTERAKGQSIASSTLFPFGASHSLTDDHLPRFRARVRYNCIIKLIR